MNKKREILLLIFLIFLFFTINYKFIDNAIVEFLEDYEEVNVERIIDGDTIVAGNNTHIRLLGINTPEKGEKYYEEAKNFLEMIILNKTVKLEYGKEKYDRYGRKLAYLFYRDANVNLELVDEGYANFYFPSGKDKYYSRFVKNWEHCMTNNKYLCEKSKDKCAECIELKELNAKNQEVIFYNKCSFDCELTGWTIKDEGRKKFIFGNFILEKNKEVKIIVSNENLQRVLHNSSNPTEVGDFTNAENILYWNDEEYVWTKTGDSLFLRDKEENLVLYRELII